MAIGFHWHSDWMTPRLLSAIGSAVIYWAMIDHRIIEVCEFAWRTSHPGERVPRSFDIRIAGLKEIAASIYKNEPDEYRIFSWYVQRLRTLNGRRDDLAHGLPGKVTKKGRTYDGIKIPFPSRDTKYSELTVEDIEELAEDLKAMEGETYQVSMALLQALQASSGNISIWQDPDGWAPLTKDNRSPKLPRENLPPPTFRE